jgi:hypothetical protein
MVLWMRFAVAALVISMETNMPPPCAFVAMTSLSGCLNYRSTSIGAEPWAGGPMDFKCRNLVTHLFENRQCVADLLREGIELSQ